MKMGIRFVMQRTRPRFTLTTSKSVFRLCLRAINAYTNKHSLPETAQRQMAQRLKRQLQHSCTAPKSISLTWAPASFLKESLEFLFRRNDQKLQDPWLRSKAQDLIGALGDYTATVEHLEKEPLTEEKTPSRTPPVDDKPWNKVRDNIFRQLVDTPPQIDIWGNVIDKEPNAQEDQKKPRVNTKILDLIHNRRRLTKSYAKNYGASPTNKNDLPEGWAWETNKVATAWSRNGDYCAMTFTGMRTHGTIPPAVFIACKEKGTKDQ